MLRRLVGRIPLTNPGSDWLTRLVAVYVTAWIGFANAGELQSGFIFDTSQQYSALVTQFTTTTVFPGNVYANGGGVQTLGAQLNVDLGTPIYYGGFFAENNFVGNPPFGQAEMFNFAISDGTTLSATAPAPSLPQIISCSFCYYGESQYEHGQAYTATAYLFTTPGVYTVTVSGPTGTGGPVTDTVNVSIGPSSPPTPGPTTSSLTGSSPLASPPPTAIVMTPLSLSGSVSATLNSTSVGAGVQPSARHSYIGVGYGKL